MSMEKRASDNRPLLALLIGPARRLWGKTRSQASAAAYGLLRLREPSPRHIEAPPPAGAGNVVPLKQRAIAVRVDEATVAPLLKRAANG